MLYDRVLNDNEMGISKNEPTFNFSALFSALGFEYFGIIDGHDISELTRYLEICRQYNITAVIELKTSAGISNWTENNTPEKSRMPAIMELIKKHNMLNRVIFLSSQELCLNWVKTNGYEYIPCQYLTLSSCENENTYNIVTNVFHAF